MTFPTTPAEVAAIDKTTNLGRGLWLRVRGGKYRSWAVRLGGKWAKTVAASKLTPAEAREMAEALLAEHEKNRERRRKEEALARMQADSDRAAEMGLLDGDQPDGDPVLARLLLRNVGEWIGPEDKGRLEAEAAARPAPSTGSGKPLGDFVEEALANIDRKNASDRRAMRSCLERYAGALLEMPIGTIRPKHVARVLRPLMAAGRKGAARNLRSALSPVFTFAVADDAIDMSPMGDARVLDALLPNKKVCGQVRHRVAVPLDRAPAAFAGMVEPVRQDGNRDAVAAARFMVLTAARPIEAARAVAGDFDLNARMWRIPGERMKAGRPHAVPLSDQAMAIVAERVRGSASDAPVFPGAAMIAGSTLAVLRVVRRGHKEADAHGWRATFVAWADKSEKPDELVFPAIAHVRGSQSDRAYSRDRDAENRRGMLQAWADYLTGET